MPARGCARAAKRAEKKRNRGQQPGSPGAAMRWRKPGEVIGHFPQGACGCGLDLASACTSSCWGTLAAPAQPISP